MTGRAAQRVQAALRVFSIFVALSALVPSVLYAEEAPPVVKVTFHTVEGLSYEDLINGLPITLGRPLEPGALQKALSLLKEREIFADVGAEIHEREHGIEIVFRLISAYSVSEVRFEGNTTFEEEQLRRIAAIRVGTRLNLDELVLMRERLIKAYRREGHHAAEVSIRFSERGTPSHVRVTIVIDEGARMIVGALGLIGEIPEEARPAVARIRESIEGSPFTEKAVRDVKQQLLTALRAEGYLQAVVDAVPNNEEPTEVDRPMIFQVDARAPVSLIFEGNTLFTPAELLAPLRIETRSVPFTPGAFVTLCREIVDMYQEQGYLFARAEVEELPPEGNRKRYVISIKEGVQVRIRAIRFVGNTIFSSAKLRKLMTVRPAGRWILKRWVPGFLVNDELSADLAAIEALYERAGYPGTTVSFDLVPSLDEPVIDITIVVREARAKTISSLDVVFEGIEDRPGETAELLEIQTSVREGDVMNTDILRDEVRKLTATLAELGYPAAVVRLELDQLSGAVRYVIDPGLRIRVGRIFFAGNRVTHDRLIRRELKFAENGLLRATDLRESEAALFRIGYFRGVNIAPADGVLDEPVEDIVVRVSERDTGTLDLEASLNSDDGLHLKGELGQRNFEGIGDGLNFGIDGYFKAGSSRLFDAGTARTLYTHRHVLGTAADLLIEGFAQYDLLLVDPFHYDRLGTSVALLRALGEEFRGTVGYQFYNENLFEVPEDVSIGPNDVGTTRYSSLFARVELDGRDSPHNPRRGVRSVIETSVASDALGAEVSFADLALQTAFYTPLADNLVFVQNVRGEVVEPFGGTDVVPVSQRLFLGGRGSLRGFSRNVVGPRGDLLHIVGGDASIVFNTELHWEITENVVLLTFLDVGQAFLRYEGDFVGDNRDLSDLRFSPGIGFRYKTPIGPVSVELGVALDRELGERFGRFNFAIGNPF